MTMIDINIAIIRLVDTDNYYGHYHGQLSWTIIGLVDTDNYHGQFLWTTITENYQIGGHRPQDHNGSGMEAADENLWGSQRVQVGQE